MGTGRSGALLPVVVAVLSVVLSSAPRIAVAAGVLPDAARPFVWSDILVGYDELLAGRKVPYWEAPFYYPPVMGYIAGLFVALTPDATWYVTAWTALLAAIAGAVAAALARTVGPQPTLLYWSAAPQLLLYSGMNFDVLPAATVVAAILYLRARHTIAGAVALAVGTIAKIFPAAALPVVLDSLRTEPRRAVAVATAFVATAAAIALPSLFAPWPSTLVAPDYAGLTNFDSFWGIGRAAFGDASALVLVPVTTVGLIATYALGVIPAARRSRDPAVGVGLAILTLMIWSRLYSPQYAIWLLPFFALLTIPTRWFVSLAVADVGVFFSVYPLSLQHWEGDPQLQAIVVSILAAAIVLRQVALVGTWLSMRDARARAPFR